MALSDYSSVVDLKLVCVTAFSAAMPYVRFAKVDCVSESCLPTTTLHSSVGGSLSRRLKPNNRDIRQLAFSTFLSDVVFLFSADRHNDIMPNSAQG